MRHNEEDSQEGQDHESTEHKKEKRRRSVVTHQNRERAMPRMQNLWWDKGTETEPETWAKEAEKKRKEKKKKKKKEEQKEEDRHKEPNEREEKRKHTTYSTRTT